MRPTRDEIKWLAELHLARYSRRISRALLSLARFNHTSGFNVGELRSLEALWLSVQAKGYEWDKLTPAEEAEVREGHEDTLELMAGAREVGRR